METQLDQRPRKRQRLEALPGGTSAASPSLPVTSSNNGAAPQVTTSDSRSPLSPRRSPSLVGAVSAQPTPSSTPVIDHTAFPHIFSAILSDVPPAALPVLRAVSRHLRDWADRRICKHLAICPERAAGSVSIADLGCNVSLNGFGQETSERPASTPLDSAPSTPSASSSTPLVLSANVTADTTVVARPPPLYLRNTTGRWQSTSGPTDADVEWLARGDNALKATTVVDIVGDASQFNLVAPLLPHLQTVRFHGTWDLSEIKRIHADEAVIFTRPEARSDRGRGPQELAVRRFVTHVGAPLPQEGSDRDYSRDPIIDFYVWSPTPPIPTVAEMVYIFDPAWYRAKISWPPNICFSSMLESVMGHASRSLMDTQFVFVGLERLPIRALNMTDEDEAFYNRHLNYLDGGVFDQLDRCWRSLGPSYIRRNKREKLGWMWMLHELNLPEGLTVEEARREMEQAIRADWGGEATRSRRARQARRSVVRAIYCDIRQWQRSEEEDDCPYRPLAEWPAEKLHGYVQERVKLLTYEEYLLLVGEEQRLLETVGYA